MTQPLPENKPSAAPNVLEFISIPELRGMALLVDYFHEQRYIETIVDGKAFKLLVMDDTPTLTLSDRINEIRPMPLSENIIKALLKH